MNNDLMRRGSFTPNRMTALVPTEESLVERMRGLRDLVLSVDRQVQEIRAIYLHNHNLGIKFVGLGPHEAPLDYKLNQLQVWIDELKAMVVPTEPIPDEPAAIEDIVIQPSRLNVLNEGGGS